MAGYGAKLDVDREALAALPTGKDPDSTRRRRKLFCQTDINGNGILSLAECDRLIVTVLHLRGVDRMKPVINRAFHAARDIVPPVGDFSPHYVDFQEFRFFLVYVKYYMELFLIFDQVDKKDGGHSDRRMSFREFEAAVPMLLHWGLQAPDADRIRDDPTAVFNEIDVNGGGVVLFDEFAHWALWNHIVSQDCDEDMAEALGVLKRQKPNLCSRDLSAIKAGVAKYRADGPIAGQKCLRGDASLAGAVPEAPDGGEELAAGRDYPGGLTMWQKSLKRVEEKETSAEGPKLCSCGCNRPAFSHYSTCCTHCKGPDGPHARDCEGKGYTLCANGCGRLPFGRFDTCCTHCKGADGPHARDCLGKVQALSPSGSSGEAATNAAPECENGCGRAPYRHYRTCCTHCHGAEGPHAADCGQKA